jgi:hypothetical protein
VLTMETAIRSKKELLAQSLSCTQVLQTLGHALSVTRSEDEGNSPVAVEVILVIDGGGRSIGPMVRKPRAKRGSEVRISSVKGFAKWRSRTMASPVLSTLDTKVCVVLHHSGFPSGSLDGKNGRSASDLYISDDPSRPGHLCLQDSNICAALR